MGTYSNHTYDEELCSTLTSQYKKLFPNSQSNEVETLLDEKIDLDVMCKYFGENSYKCILERVGRNVYYEWRNWYLTNETIPEYSWRLSNGMSKISLDWDSDNKGRLEETGKVYLKRYKNFIDVYEKIYKEVILENSININEFLSYYPDLEKKITNQIKDKLLRTRKSIDLSYSITLDLKVNVEMDTTDEEIKSKIEEYCKSLVDTNDVFRRLHFVSIQKKFGDDYFKMKEIKDRNSSYDYKILKVEDKS